MSSTAVQGRTDGGIHRRVEHIMGMPISLALRGRHTATAAAHQAWQEVIKIAPDSREGQAAKRALESLQSAHPPPARAGAQGAGEARKPGITPRRDTRPGVGLIPAAS